MNCEILNIFDFDDTLFRTQNFAIAENLKRSMYEWYDSPQSLSPNFKIAGIENILKKARDPESLNYVITHRTKECKPEILELLAREKCKIKEVITLGRTEEKAQVVKSIILGNIQTKKTIVIYEDSIIELIKYVKSLSELLKFGINIQLVFVDKSRIIKMPWKVIKTLAKSESEDYEKIQLT